LARHSHALLQWKVLGSGAPLCALRETMEVGVVAFGDILSWVWGKCR
jgi:hypothetical protein